MAVVIVHQTESGIVVLTAPLDGVVDAVGTFRYFTIGGVGVGGADVTVVAVELADVFGQIPAVSVPCAVLLDGQRAGGYRLGGIPGDEPECRVVAAGEVTAGDLQVASIEVSLMERYFSVYCYLFGGAAAHVVIGTFDDRVRLRIVEAYGAVFGIVGDAPDTCGGFHQRLVAIGIEGGGEITHGGVLIQLISGIICG